MSLEEVAKRIELAKYDTRQVEPGSREKLLDRVAWAAYYMIEYMKVAVDVSWRRCGAICIWEMERLLGQALLWQAELLAWVRHAKLS
jgi:hypothetical protein